MAWTRLRAPQSLMAPSAPDAMAATVAGSALAPKYAETVDRESARELLAAKLEAGAATARAEPPVSPAPTGDGRIGYPTSARRTTQRKVPRTAGSGGMVQDILGSPLGRDLARTAAREIVRGVFGIGRRRR